MPADTILAIDLGRYKGVACAYSRATRQHAFVTLDTTPAEVDKLLARHAGAVVVVEACANAGWVHARPPPATRWRWPTRPPRRGSSSTSGARPTAARAPG